MEKWLDSIAVIFVRGLSGFLQLLPLSTALAIGRFLGRIGCVLNSRTRLAYVNLKASFPGKYTSKERKQIIKRLFEHLGQNVAEMLCFPKLDLHYFNQFIKVQHRERYEALRTRKNGAILMTPHFGNWELTQILAAINGEPLHVLARRQKFEKLNDYLNSLRASHGSVAVEKGSGNIRDFIRALKEKKLVGALGDLSGGWDGDVITFFGRKTTGPSGIFKIAARTGSVMLPCFIVRKDKAYHEVFIENPLPLADSGNEDADAHQNLQHYYHLLEHWISKHPDQWLWVYKRWKHCFTKRILILKDGRAGHESQSDAVRRDFEALQKTLPPYYEFEFKEISVRFKSQWHQKLFFGFSYFFAPFSAGRLGVLKWFIEEKAAQALESTHADIIISAGSSLIPLNLLLQNENLAKSIVLMRPPFPYHSRQFNLLIVPVHDDFREKSKSVVRTVLTPNQVTDDFLKKASEEFQDVQFEKHLSGRRISIFIGGSTKSYQFEEKRFIKWLEQLKALAAETQIEFLVTTSRRTDPVIQNLVKKTFEHDPACKLLIIANEKNRRNATYGMLALSDEAIVTEDSISMVSEAVSAGKRVTIMKLGKGKLSAKHLRFQEALKANSLATIATPENFKAEMNGQNGFSGSRFRETETQTIREALRKLL